MPAPSPLTKVTRTASTEEVVMSEHLAELRGRVRLLTWLSGLGWTSLALLGGLLVTGTLDWLIHFDESGTRLLLSLTLLGTAGWIIWRYLIAPLREQLTGSFLASRVERRFPGMNSRIVSAVEFLEHRLDGKLGSTEMQKAVVWQALKDLVHVQASDVVETRSVRTVTVAGTLVFLVALLVAVLHPLEAATSVQRLILPFANVPWPRAVELQLIKTDLSVFDVSPDKPLLIARGETLELYVRNKRGRLPERVWFEYRTSQDGPVIRESLRQTTIRDDQGRSVDTAVISWIASQGKLSFRATAGDDNVMPFQQIEVVPPPIIKSMQVVMTPPKYSQRPVETLPAGVGHVQGLLGSRVDVVVQCDKPLMSAVLRIGNHPPEPLTLSADESRFDVSFEIKDATTSSYWFELTDKQGFADREPVHYELRGIPDVVPEVNIEAPIADVLLTADAEVPVKVLAKDDLGLRELRLAYQVDDAEELNFIRLYPGVADAESPVSAESVAAFPVPPTGPLIQEADLTWKMSDLNPEPGMRIIFRAEATDAYDIGPPHVGKSIPRTITIVSKTDKQKDLAGRVADLLGDLKQATQLQKRARQLTKELQTQLDNVGELRSQDLDQLRRAELDQRQTGSRLNQPAEGIEAQARQLLDEFRSNHLQDSGTQQRLENLSDELGRLGREELTRAEQALTQAQKLAEESTAGNESSPAGNESGKNESGTEEKGESPPPQPNPALTAALDEAQTRQTRSLDTLQELQESLAEWRDRRDIAGDLESMIAEQEQVQKEASDLAQRTITKSDAELTKQEHAELNKLSAKQRKIAEQLDQFRKQADQTARSLEKNDPDMAERLNEIGQQLATNETAGTLQDAAQAIADHKMGSAAEAQQKAIEELRQSERMMKRQPTEDTEQFLKQTQEAQQEFRQLRQDQQMLNDQADQLARQPDSPEKDEQMKQLLERQEELIERMAKAERKLERLRLRGAAEAANRARQRLSEMMENLADADEAEDPQQAMDEALEDLEQVERELVLEKRIAQERLAFEQLEKIEDELKSLRTRQAEVVTETARLDAARTDQESLSRGQLRTLKDLAENERSLQQIAEQMQQQMASAEVFSLVLKRLARTLKLAADRLGERETAAATQALEQDAIKKIDSLLAVLKQDQKKPQQPAQPQPEELGEESKPEEEKPEQARPPGTSIPQLAQLKLLKTMQEEYLEQTELLNRSRDKDGKLPEAMQAEMDELVREQNELADFARNLITTFLQQQPDQDAAQPPEQKPKPKPNDPQNNDPGKKVKPKEVDPNKIDLQ